MSQSSVTKTVGGVTTKTTTTTKSVTSSSQQQILMQQQRQQQQQTQQKVTTKPPHRMETQKNNISVKNESISEKNRQNQHYDEPVPKMNPQPEQPETEQLCVRCNKIVYKLVEVIAENQVWHRNCFRCNKCDKQLNRHSKVDSFHIHEGVVYCKFDYKQLFGHNEVPKRKPEFIICENEPAQLPDGVVRSSEQYRLGLEDIQTDAIKSRFQMFEKIATTKEGQEELLHNIGVNRSASVLSKMKKFHAKGMDVGFIESKINEKQLKSEPDDDESIDSDEYEDADLIRAKRIQQERPLALDNMNEIKGQFEAGMGKGREARHMERKQEIQNIRSKLFLGKQARTKEMYENAVTDLQSTSKLRNKSSSTAHELETIRVAAEKAPNIKHGFESGDVYRRKEFDDDQDSKTPQTSSKVSERMQMLAKQQAQDDLIKSHAKVKVLEKPDISNQYEFFENYDPEEFSALKVQGVKIDGLKADGTVERARGRYIDRVKKSKIIKKQEIDKANAQSNNSTASKATVNGKIASPQKQAQPTDPKIKEEVQRFADESESEARNEVSSRRPGYLDSDLEHARQAARTRDLKELFEEWNYVNNVCDPVDYNDSIPEYEEIDESQTETTKSIRAKFERLPHTGC